MGSTLTSPVTVAASEDTEPGEAALSLADRRFRRQFNIALRRLVLRGEITREQQHRYRVASYNSLVVKDGLSVIQALRIECEQMAGDLLDDLTVWWEWLVQWIIENWALVLKILLSLLVLLDTPQ